MDIVLAVLIGGIASYFLYDFIGKKQAEKRTVRQSHLLLDKIKSVCKLTTVEGDFSEIYHYENKSAHFLRMLSSKKRAPYTFDILPNSCTGNYYKTYDMVVFVNINPFSFNVTYFEIIVYNKLLTILKF